MSIAGAEALAGLQLLVAVARADSDLTTDERAVIAEALEDAKLPDGIRVRALIESSSDVDALIAQIESQDARDVAFGACLAMANANSVRPPNQQAVLDKLERAWGVPGQEMPLCARVSAGVFADDGRDAVLLTPLESTADRDCRAALVAELVLGYSILAAAVVAEPVPPVSIATDLAVVGLQARMFREIGGHWGRVTSAAAVEQVIAGLGLRTGTRVAVNGLMRFVPGADGAFAASSTFAYTWALGRVAEQYWESGGNAAPDAAELAELRATFASSKAEGRRRYEQHDAEVAAKHRIHAALITDLATEYRARRITLADYERRIIELK